MFSKYKFILHKLKSSMSIRAAIYCFIAISAVFFAKILGGFIPEQIVELVSIDALDQVLKIISSSMLVVVTFSLSIVVTAYATISKDMTPRATDLIKKDSHSQRAISIFLSSFIFSVASIVVISSSYYPPEARITLFAITIILLFMIVFTIIGWLDYLRGLGRVNKTIETIEDTLSEVLNSWAKYPSQKASCYDNNVSQGQNLVKASETGYITFIDINKLSELAEQNNLLVKVEVRPGEFVYPFSSILSIDSKQAGEELSDELINTIRKKVVIDKKRNFDLDPEYGLIVLSEMASKAL